jgi:intracellular multiplication protein IcmC
MAGSTQGFGGNYYSINTQQAYINLVNTAIDIELFMMIASYVAGIIMIIRGIALYKAFGQNINQATRPGEVAGPFVYIVVGTLLLYFPTIFQISLYTIFGTTEVEDLTATAATGSYTVYQWDQIYTVITRYCRLVGVISFFRGLILLSKSGEPGVQPGSITRGIIHVVAGVMIYNIKGTVDALQYTFGISVVS